MVKKLRNRFAAICALLTGVVIIAMSAVTYSLAANLAREKHDVVFEDVFSELLESLRLEAVIRDDRLSVLEADGNFIIDISENDASLFYNGAADDKLRAEILESAQSKADELGVTKNSIDALLRNYPSADFELNSGDGQRVRAKLLRTSSGSIVRLIVVMSLSDLNSELSALMAQFLLITVSAVVVLALISFFLASRAVKPIAKSIADQNEFIASASHELRSPLAVIRAALSVYYEKRDADKLAAATDKESERMAHLTDDLLSLASSDANRWRLQLESVGLDVLLLEVFEALAPVAAKKNHSLKTDMPRDLLPTLTTDKARLRQIIEILLTNALDHTSEGTTVTLGARTEKGFVHITVADNGNGIPDKDKKRVFDRFYRADLSRTEKTHFGLGLSVATELTTLLGGTLTLSDTEGGGATFVLSLPI